MLRRELLALQSSIQLLRFRFYFADSIRYYSNPNTGTVYTREPTEETEALSSKEVAKPYQDSAPTEASSKVENYEGSAAQEENIERYGQDRYKALEACVDKKIAEGASIDETASDCNPSNF